MIRLRRGNFHSDADDLVTVGAYLSLVMATVGRVGAGMEVVDGSQAGQSWGWSHVGRCRSISSERGDTVMTRDHTAIQLRGSV